MGRLPPLLTVPPEPPNGMLEAPLRPSPPPMVEVAVSDGLLLPSAWLGALIVRLPSTPLPLHEDS